MNRNRWALVLVLAGMGLVSFGGGARAASSTPEERADERALKQAQDRQAGLPERSQASKEADYQVAQRERDYRSADQSLKSAKAEQDAIQSQLDSLGAEVSAEEMARLEQQEKDRAVQAAEESRERKKAFDTASYGERFLEAVGGVASGTYQRIVGSDASQEARRKNTQIQKLRAKLDASKKSVQEAETQANAYKQKAEAAKQKADAARAEVERIASAPVSDKAKAVAAEIRASKATQDALERSWGADLLLTKVDVVKSQKNLNQQQLSALQTAVNQRLKDTMLGQYIKAQIAEAKAGGSGGGAPVLSNDALCARMQACNMMGGANADAMGARGTPSTGSNGRSGGGAAKATGAIKAVSP